MPKNIDHDEHRRELLGKCFDLFCLKGYSNVTMRGIARETGVSTGALYHYFPTKINILEQMFAWALETDIGEYVRRADKDIPLQEKVGNIVTYWYGRESYYRKLLLLAMDLYRNSPDAAIKVLNDFAEYYKGGIAQSLGINRRLSEVVFNYLLGCVAHTLLAPTQFEYEKEVVFVRDTLIFLLSTDSVNAAGAKAARDTPTARLLKTLISKD